MVEHAARAHERGGVGLHRVNRVAANINVGANKYVANVPHEPGGVRPGLACVAAKPAEVVEHAAIEVHKQAERSQP